jgi:hypothetical protein
VSDDRLLLTVIDASWHVRRRMSLQRTVCSVDALGVKATTLQVVGTGCGEQQSQHSTRLLDIDPTTGSIVGSRDIGADATAVAYVGDAVWMIIGKTGSDRKRMRRVAR